MTILKNKIIATTQLEIFELRKNKEKFIITGEWCDENSDLTKIKNKIEIIKNPFENKKFKKKKFF